jgi:F-type H+-transporting ATPase subunit gamma
MSSEKAIKKRIASIGDTRKITNAMYLISSTKVSKAKAELDHSRPYFNALRNEISNIFQISSKLENHYFYPADEQIILRGPVACLVVTADKGLAGAYNQNVIKEALKMRDKYDTLYFVVGEYGRQAFYKRHIPIERSFLYTAQNPTMRRAREIADVLLGLYNTNKVDKIYLIYTDMENSMNVSVQRHRLLPFVRNQFLSEDGTPQSKPSEFEFVPSINVVLDNIMESYISGFIYSALVASFCSEQNARMTAMSSANDNAQKLLDELSLDYNHVRQAAITREITEVSASAAGQRRKREKEELQ